jgi:hypothetical protein
MEVRTYVDNFCNVDRRHSDLGYVNPIDVRVNRTDSAQLGLSQSLLALAPLEVQLALPGALRARANLADDVCRG